MVMWQKGLREWARSFFDQAVAWTRKNDPNQAELLGFWREAADLPGQPGPKAPPIDLPAVSFAP